MFPFAGIIIVNGVSHNGSRIGLCKVHDIVSG